MVRYSLACALALMLAIIVPFVILTCDGTDPITHPAPVPAEDDAGWWPALYDDDGGHLLIDGSPFPALHR